MRKRIFSQRWTLKKIKIKESNLESRKIKEKLTKWLKHFTHLHGIFLLVISIGKLDFKNVQKY